ncbi:unnamed protein product [Fusarium venenatum]|uniref:Zn(2)-C6 fungal-type domain-containing protein n=1 Tax=Fusarium venenatum TaxID=56646 RepID=A0A2L2TQ11_9HYPO|nr:uncharacterized protein FVRRES_02078 [Fusarium venenatum]CEI65566.1 unnamed protein product [Fusarium venenatum]
MQGEETIASKTNKPRQRRAHTRSRTGCSECRNRRVRCDEQKPQCKNCINSQRICEYPPVKIPLRERRALEKAAGDVQPWQATTPWEHTPRETSRYAKRPEVPNSQSLVAQLALSTSVVNMGCSSIHMPLRSQELFHYCTWNSPAGLFHTDDLSLWDWLRAWSFTERSHKRLVTVSDPWKLCSR